MCIPRDALPLFLANAFIGLRPLVLGIDGGSALGKSTLAQQLAPWLEATVISTDSYALPRAERTKYCMSPYNPRSFRLEDLIRDVRTLTTGGAVLLGEYNHATGTLDEPLLRKPSEVLIVEGVHSSLLRAVTCRIFLDAPEGVMRRRRRERDERLGNTDEHWHRRWTTHYRAYQRYVLPRREHATMTIDVN